jgi:LicD family
MECHYWNGKMLPYDQDIDFQMLFSQLSTLQKLNSTVYQHHFLLDVNPNARDRGIQEKNVIDARFICTNTGLYVDITLLAQVDKGVYGCKSPHFYWDSDLFPLKSTLLEGTQVWRPNNVVDILYQEYGPQVLFQ